MRSPHPRTSRASVVIALSLAIALTASGCESADSAQVTPPIVLSIGATEAPVYADGTVTLYSSRLPVPFPIKRPTWQDLAALKGAVPPYPHPPYLLASDETVEVNYTVTNMDSAPRSVWVLLDPWNEFVQYRPAVANEPALSGFAQPVVLAPLERVQGNITPQEMTTLAVKLDTAMQISATTFGPDAAFGATTLIASDFDPQTVPGPSDPLLAAFVPTVVAGLTGFDLALEAESPMNVALEVTVTVTDASGQGKVLPPGTTSGLIGAPPTLLQVQGLPGAARTAPSLR
jgi:hypothetical protein